MVKKIKQQDTLYTKVAKTVRKAEVRRQATKREDQRFYNALRHGQVEFD